MPETSSRYRYTYGNTTTDTSATFRIKAKSLETLAGWRAHAMDVPQSVDVVLDGTWQVTRTSQPAAKIRGSLRFTFTGVDLTCVVPLYKQ